MAHNDAALQNPSGNPIVARLRDRLPALWIRPRAAPRTDQTPITPGEIREVEQRLSRFRPVLAALFTTTSGPAASWDGRIRSALLEYPSQKDLPALLVKADHDLPMTGSVKARGGVYELLCRVEAVALVEGLVKPGEALTPLLTPAAKALFSRHRIVVASTGNLGFSIGLVARAFGLEAEVHMSHDAKTWKKERLRRTGAHVIEHPVDYTETVARARASASASGSYFIDDESSRLLFVGYTAAAAELAEQLSERGLKVDSDTPLVVYLPCGVGGAPGGITAGLKTLYGENVRCVFVEPVASACVLAALAVGNGAPVSVYDIGLDNDTIADGLAVPVASALVMSSVGASIDAAAAVPDTAMLEWVRRAWNEAGLRLEPSAASGFAAVSLFLEATRRAGAALPPGAIHVVWTTGGSQLPEDQFTALLQGDAS
jgi:D-serine dehydratase